MVAVTIERWQNTRTIKKMCVKCDIIQLLLYTYSCRSGRPQRVKCFIFPRKPLSVPRSKQLFVHHCGLNGLGFDVKREHRQKSSGEVHIAHCDVQREMEWYRACDMRENDNDRLILCTQLEIVQLKGRERSKLPLGVSTGTEKKSGKNRKIRDVDVWLVENRA